jgi:hypothetical protein
MERIIDEEKTRGSGYDDDDEKRRTREEPTVILYSSKAPGRETSSPPSL